MIFQKFFSRLSQINALIIKEFHIIWSDYRNRIMIILPPIIEIGIFAFTATLEVKNISMVMFDKDNTYISRSLSEKFENTPVVKKVYKVDNYENLKDLIDRQKAYMAVVIPQNFQADIFAGKGSEVQFILDGRKSNAAQIIGSYFAQIVNNFTYEIDGVNVPKASISIDARNWFNPNVDYQWFIVISLIAVLSMVMVLAITSLTLAQEKELGTFDQILVSPLKSSEILIGKTVPAIIISLLDVTIMILAALWIFNIPLTSSLFTLYFCIIVFLLSICGIGLFISVICSTQQQAILGVFVFLVPVFLLSGYMTPIENMPVALQKLGIINPLTYFFTLIKGVFLKDISFVAIMENVIPLLIIAVLTLGFVNWFFKKKLD